MMLTCGLIDQKNIIESPENTHTHACSQLIFDKSFARIQKWRKMVFSINSVGNSDMEKEKE